jgi:predicted nucleic acid-binding protein
MNVIPDTCVWSELLRKRSGNSVVVDALQNLTLENRVRIIGPIRQEILSGISDPQRFVSIKTKLHRFNDIPLKTQHFELAADLSNQCRRAGIQGSPVDFLICAISKVSHLSIFTNDPDFKRYNVVFGLNLYTIS